MSDDFYSWLSDDEQRWCVLRAWLLPIVKAWVYGAHIVIWRKQQDDIAEDITQEALMRVFATMKSTSVVSLYGFCRITARNVFIDRIRKENRLVHFAVDEGYYEVQLSSYEQESPETIALNHLMLEEDVVLVAQFIANAPAKQQAALLAHLAKDTDIDAPPSSLELALVQHDIHLREYGPPPFEDEGAVSRQSALLWHIRKRLKKEYEQAYL
jgi:DNA-directed RNA polymerase specialized sigma24 family protein